MTSDAVNGHEVNRRMAAARMLAAVWLTLAGPLAHADSILLGGMVDGGLSYTNNVGGKPLWAALNGTQFNSNVHFTGNENLGGGNSAVFYLYAPFNIQNGVIATTGGNGFFNATGVGLASARWGTVTFGRQWEPVVDMLSPYASSTWLGYFASHVGDGDNLHATARTNNSIKYTSAQFAGLTLGALYAPDGGSNKREQSVSAIYARQSFSLAVGYFGLDRSEASAVDNAAVLAAGQAGVTRFDASPNLRAIALRQKTYLAGASYTFRAVTFNGIYSHLNYDYANETSISLYNAEANVRFRLTPTDRLTLAYVHTAVTDGPNGYRPTWNQINAGAEHWLSTLTDLYATFVYQQVSGAGVTGAQIFGSGKSSTSRQVVAVFGMRHAF